MAYEKQNFVDGQVLTAACLNCIEDCLVDLEAAVATCLTSETDPTVPAWAKSPRKPTYTATEVGAQPIGNYVKSVNGESPDEDGNVEITIPDSGGDVDLTGYATEQWVQTGYQPKGEYLTDSELTTTINIALAQAKESGEFDGTDGYTPVRGTDYWTDADKTEIVNATLAALPTWTGGSY